MSIEAKIRKYQDIAKCSAGAVVAFGLWTAIWSYYIFFTSYDELCDIVSADPTDIMIKRVSLIITSIAVVIDILFRILMYRQTIKATRLGGKIHLIIILCIIYLLVNVTSFSGSVSTFYELEQIGEIIIFVLIEISSYIAVIEIGIASIMVSKYRGKLASKEIQ